MYTELIDRKLKRRQRCQINAAHKQIKRILKALKKHNQSN